MAHAAWRHVPPGVWALGVVSMLMDISSEMVHALLPAFLVVSFGASMTAIGWLEGLAEATALLVRMVSGAWSDALPRRKPLVMAGYTLGALSKPFFALAPGFGWVMGARVADRIGKGIRGAPRDALVADLAAPEQRGAAFGLRQSLDTIGAFCGPLLAMGLMLWWANDMRRVFAAAIVPGVLAVLVLWLFVREPVREPAQALGVDQPAPRVAAPTLRTRWARFAASARQLPAPLWRVVAMGAVFTLARMSEAFLILKATAMGAPLAALPLVLVVMNVAYAASAYPLGALSDRWPRERLLLLGMGLLVGADVALALAANWWLLASGLVLWGLHMGATQGVMAAMVAQAAPPALRGTAFGCFSLASGLAMLVGSVAAGWLWDAFGAAAAFAASAGCAVMAAALLLSRGGREGRPEGDQAAA